MLGEDVGFPAAALPILCQAIDAGEILPGTATSMYGRFEWALDFLKAHKTNKYGGKSFKIFHGSRNGYGDKSLFGLVEHAYNAVTDEWKSKEFNLGRAQSFQILNDGSGGEIVADFVMPLTISIGAVSRVHFEGFCKALHTPGGDNKSGGAPQLLGLGNVGNGRHYGVSFKSNLFFQGKPSSFEIVPPGTQWRNESFQPIGLNGPIIKNRRRKLIKGARRPPKLY